MPAHGQPDSTGTMRTLLSLYPCCVCKNVSSLGESLLSCGALLDQGAWFTDPIACSSDWVLSLRYAVLTVVRSCLVSVTECLSPEQ